jgi:hypothetical protein
MPMMNQPGTILLTLSPLIWVCEFRDNINKNKMKWETEKPTGRAFLAGANPPLCGLTTKGRMGDMDEPNQVVEIEVQDLPPLDEQEMPSPVTTTEYQATVDSSEGMASTPADTSAESVVAPLDGESVASLMRLAVGSTLLGAGLVQERIQAWEAAHPARPGQAGRVETGADRARYAMVGMMFQAYENNRRRLTRVMETGASISAWWMTLMRPVARSPLFSPARRRYEKLVEVGTSRVEAWVNTGRNEEQRSRQMANDLFQELVKEVTVFLGDNQDVSLLINQVADELLANLAQDPQVAELIQAQGNNYLIYLQEENAEQVQQLIQGQSLDLAGQVLDEVRERTVTADTVAERLVRAILRRTRREDLPPPPPEVQRWANTQPPSTIVTEVESTADFPPGDEGD